MKGLAETLTELRTVIDRVDRALENFGEAVAEIRETGGEER